MKNLLLPLLLLSVATMRAAAPDTERPVVYQLLVRTFGNTNETRQPDGTLAENGCGKFADINDNALASLKAMGFTHVWLTGVLQQATATDYSSVGQPADDPDLLKGRAGSPYAIKDYHDVCPDYAQDPARRLEEFKELLARVHAAGMRAVIDLVPNHVARSHHSDVRPESDFGVKDDTAKFFDPANNFFWMPGPLRLPKRGDGDGLFAPETERARVTGNNVASAKPGAGDWYETVKLNFGWDFTKKTRAYPWKGAPGLPMPDTWAKMDAIVAYWQAMGVDGFRCDMAHMVPPEFWKWSIARARERQPGVLFMAEAYDGDPAKVPAGDVENENVMETLLRAGFDAVYDDPSYDVLEGLYSSGKWCNDLDGTAPQGDRFHRSLRYAENHDEVRLASAKNWGGLGMKVGRPVSAVLFALGRGPVMIYNGQEVGEPALGAEGFGGDDGRTSIFDYWSMPELVKWVNGGQFDGGGLGEEQRELRAWYARLLAVTKGAAFQRGEFFALNPANNGNPRFGRIGGETASGHWLYAFLRRDAASGEAFLVVANFHGSETLRQPAVLIPDAAQKWLGLESSGKWSLKDELGGAWQGGADRAALAKDGIALPDMPPCSAMFIKIAGE